MRLNWLPFWIVMVLITIISTYSFIKQRIDRSVTTDSIQVNHSSLPRGVRAGKIKLSTEFSKTFVINPGIGENIYFQVVKGGLEGEMLINGRKIESLILSGNPLDRGFEINETLCSIAFRNTKLGENKEMAYWICLGQPPNDWFRQVMLLE